MFKRVVSLVVIMVALMFAPSPAFAQDESVPQAVSAETIPCPMPLPESEIDGETIICGQMQVPENWEDPDGPLITITFSRQVSKNLASVADPIIFFAGGPGGSVLAAQGSGGFDFSFLRQTRDVIVWDQRGTRYSSDLDCPPDVMIPDRTAFEEAREIPDPAWSVDSDPQDVLEQSRANVDVFGIDNCAAYLAEQGRDVAQYDTPNTVKDAIALMKHLDYPAYNLFGISYGTQVSLAIMEYYENHPVADLPPLRSAVIDGVFPRNISSAEDALVAPYNILRIFTNCEADEACAAAYPEIHQRFVDLLAQLEAAPIVTTDGSEVTLDDVMTILYTAISQSTKLHALAPYFPRLVDELSRNEGATYAAIMGIISGEISATPTQAVAGATNPLDPITQQAASLAQEIRAIADQIDALGASTGELAAAIDIAETLDQLYVAIWDSYLESVTPEERNAYANFILEEIVPFPELHSRAGLTMLQSVMPEFVAGELSAILNLMGDDDVSMAWAAMADPFELQRMLVIGQITNAVVKCNDRGSEYNPAQAYEMYRAFEAPQLITQWAIVADYYAKCEVFGLAAPKFALRTPVAASLRTLVMNGEADHATPVEWGELAVETLTNAVMVNVPMTDHGTTRYSKCAKDIANTFFLYPDQEVDLSCVEAFRTQYVLLGDPLPGAVNE